MRKTIMILTAAAGLATALGTVAPASAHSRYWVARKEHWNQERHARMEEHWRHQRMERHWAHERHVRHREHRDAMRRHWHHG